LEYRLPTQGDQPTKRTALEELLKETDPGYGTVVYTQVEFVKPKDESPNKVVDKPLEKKVHDELKDERPLEKKDERPLEKKVHDELRPNEAKDSADKLEGEKLTNELGEPYFGDKFDVNKIIPVPTLVELPAEEIVEEQLEMTPDDQSQKPSILGGMLEKVKNLFLPTQIPSGDEDELPEEAIIDQEIPEHIESGDKLKPEKHINKPADHYSGDSFDVDKIIPVKELGERLKEQPDQKVGQPIEQKYAGDNFEVDKIIPAKEVDKRLKEMQPNETDKHITKRGDEYSGAPFDVAKIIPVKEVEERLKEQKETPPKHINELGEGYNGDKFSTAAIIPVKSLDKRLKEMQPTHEHHTNELGESYEGDKFDVDKIIPVNHLDEKLKEYEAQELGKPHEQKYAGDSFDVGSIIPVKNLDKRLKEMQPAEDHAYINENGEHYHGDKFDVGQIIPAKNLDARLQEQQSVHAPKQHIKPGEHYSGNSFDVGSIIPVKNLDKRLEEVHEAGKPVEQKYAGDNFDVSRIIPAKSLDKPLIEQEAREVGKPTEQKRVGDNLEIGSIIPAKTLDEQLKEQAQEVGKPHEQKYAGDSFDAASIIPVKDLDKRLKETQPGDQHEGIGHELKKVDNSGDKLEGTQHTNELGDKYSGDKFDANKIIKTEARDERRPKDTTEIAKDQADALTPEERQQKRFSLGGVFAKVKHLLHPKDSQDVALQGTKQTHAVTH
jgi:hypothetical protein